MYQFIDALTYWRISLLLPHFGNYEYTRVFRHCVFFCICNFLAFVELGSGISVQMRIPVLIPGASYWDYKSKVLPEKAAWLLGMGLWTASWQSHVPSPPRPFSAGAPGPPSLETLSTPLPLDSIVCLTTQVNGIGGLENLPCFVFLLPALLIMKQTLPPGSLGSQKGSQFPFLLPRWACSVASHNISKTPQIHHAWPKVIAYLQS